MARAQAPWRLLLDGPADGAWNMAVDEALLDSYAGAAPPAAPTLRLYAWRPALSLGRHQPALGAHDGAYLRREGIDLVRRPTGGRAVLHEHERTYAICARLRHPPFAGGVSATYRCIAELLCAVLRALGVDARHAADGSPPGPPAAACFAATSRHEVTVAGRKL
ncbi:MAG TPA: hypothetical protein VJS92_16415, partial [Candidatus Polarisedimenticolaceae bacterium]|nr:hypothetical protein [Candidatus Polarisedimenticolaceae bacterium]